MVNWLINKFAKLVNLWNWWIDKMTTFYNSDNVSKLVKLINWYVIENGKLVNY